MTTATAHDLSGIKVGDLIGFNEWPADWRGSKEPQDIVVRVTDDAFTHRKRDGGHWAPDDIKRVIRFADLASDHNWKIYGNNEDEVWEDESYWNEHSNE